MTWLDISIVVAFLIFIGIGFRVGSIWIGACFLAGFFAAAVVDTYTFSLAGFLGHWPGAHLVSRLFLYALVILIILGPVYLMKKFKVLLVVGFFDHMLGVFLGALSGVILVATILLWSFNRWPELEQNKAYAESLIAKPMRKTCLWVIKKSSNVNWGVIKKIEDKTKDAISSVTKEASETLKLVPIKK